MPTLSSFKVEYGLLIIGAIVFTASFLWKDFITDFEDIYFPKTRGLFGRFVFIIIVTMILVLIAIYIRDKLGLGARHFNFGNFDQGYYDSTGVFDQDKNDSKYR